MQTIYAASISYGKDSIAMLHVIIDILKLPLDRIFTVDVWFDDETRAELPPMIAWKEEADKMIYERWGIKVDHLCAMRGGNEIATHDTLLSVKQEADTESEKYMDSLKTMGVGVRNLKPKKLTYKDIFYRVYKSGAKGGGDTRIPN